MGAVRGIPGGPPFQVLEWNDAETGARGWLAFAIGLALERTES